MLISMRRNIAFFGVFFVGSELFTCFQLLHVEILLRIYNFLLSNFCNFL